MKFEREDWSLFRTVEGLAQRAGVPPQRLIRLAMKELADNALDSIGPSDNDVVDQSLEELSPRVGVGELPKGRGYYVETGEPLHAFPTGPCRLRAGPKPKNPTFMRISCDVAAANIGPTT